MCAIILSRMGKIARYLNELIIGNVFDTIKDDDGITIIVRIEPSSNIEGERYVIVLSRKNVSTS